MSPRLLCLPLALLLLTGCASSPEAEVREGVRDVLAAANDQDADAVRRTVDDLLSTLRAQVGSGELTDAQAAPVRDAAREVLQSVAALEVEQTPSPTPTPEETEEPTPAPEPSEEPEETEEPTPAPTPEPTEEPQETEPPVTEAPETEAPETQAPDEDGGDDDDDQATVVPELPLTPTASPVA